MAAQLHPQNADFELAVLSAANTNWDGTGTIVDVVTGTASAKKEVYWITITATGTTTEGWIKFFSYDGTNTRFLCALKVAAGVPTATKRPWSYSGPVPGMPSGVIAIPGATDKLQMATHIAETFHVRAEWRNYV